jgi:hypothetical protein
VAETDILNPTPRHPLNPDYSFAKKRPVTHLNAKANQGKPYFRDITDIGHQFSLNWADRLAHDARRLKWYYEQYRDGFFTFIDHEGGGRHYVGRFSTPVEPSPVSHNHWTVQQVLFDEVPGVPMVQYPSDWEGDAIWRYLLNDFGDRMVSAVAGTWTLTTDVNAKKGQSFQNAGTVTTDAASYVYAGYGFRFFAPTGPAYGQANILLDGTSVGTIDFYSAVAAASTPIFQLQNVPLGLHKVSLQPLNTKNSGSSGYTVLWDTLQVMR